MFPTRMYNTGTINTGHIMARLRKNCTDIRFLKVQERFFDALGKTLHEGTLAKTGVAGLAGKAKVWDTTFYDHFRNLDDAIKQYDHRHDEEIKNLRDDILCTCPTMEYTFTKILVFIKSNKKYYKAHLERQNPAPFFSIAKIFRPILARSWSFYGRDQFDLCFRMFSGEFYGIIHFWGESEKFNESKINGHVARLIRLAQNATQRLY
ncbi:hypothetical protein IJH10_00630 [Candidatus Saccharibacteria bacterium]|nr:hypothetical protein [Candidatus Saccharibacteria bacterium]